MNAADPLISVIIPTLGRESLARSIRSVLAQQQRVEIVVVNDSGSPLSMPDMQGVLVVDTAGRIGAAAARNVGLAATSGDLIAFLDDDDVWLAGHLKDAVGSLQRHPEAKIYASRGLVLDPRGRGRVEPVQLLGSRTVREYFYGRGAWRGRCRRILTPTIVFRGSLRDHQMDPSLTQSEDTWWLLTAEKERDGLVIQSDHIGVVVNTAPARAIGRGESRDTLDWALRLDTVGRGTGAGSLAGRGRDLARAGRPGEIVSLARGLRVLSDGWKWAPVLGVETGVATAVALHRRLRRGGRVPDTSGESGPIGWPDG